MKASDKQMAGVIKGAAINLLLAVLCKNSSNVDEAIIQFNELGKWFEVEIRKRYSGRLLLPDEFEMTKIRLDGDR